MVEPESRTYYVAFAIAVSQGLPFDQPLQMLREAWRAGVEVTRYNRTWRLSRILYETNDLVAGRIGFVNEGELATLGWNAAEQDFTVGAASSGVTVPFVIRKSDLVIAYQVRPGIVRENTFSGAFAALLNKGSGQASWSVESYTSEVAYGDWVKTVDHVERIDVTVDRPNPHYGDDHILEEAVEGLRAEAVRIVARARAGEDLDLSYPLIDQAVDHVLRGYGQARIVGQTAEGEPSTWMKLRGRVGSVLRVRSRKATGEVEAPADVLESLLEEAPSGSEVQRSTAADDDLEA